MRWMRRIRSPTRICWRCPPGLDRPIRDPGDYERFRGRLARFKMAQPMLGQTVVIGRIQKLDGTHVWVEVQAAKANRGGAEEHTSELQSLTDISYAVFCL